MRERGGESERERERESERERGGEREREGEREIFRLGVGFPDYLFLPQLHHSTAQHNHCTMRHSFTVVWDPMALRHFDLNAITTKMNSVAATYPMG